MSALLEQDQNSKIVEVVSAEGQSHNISVNTAKHSGLLSRLIDDDNQNEAQFISLPPLSNVNSAILSKVIEFLEHYNMEPMNEIEKVNNCVFHVKHRPHNIFYSAFEVCEHWRRGSRLLCQFYLWITPRSTF